jgi:protein-S-isoprenylcysteine O-methyltransferase Ste14
MDLWPQRRLDLPIDGSVTMEAGVSGLKTQPLRPPSGPACDQVRAGWRRPLPAVRLMDWVEKAIAAALLLGGVATGIEAGAQPLVLLFLAPNVLFLALVLFRRKPKEIGARAADWVLPIAASAAPQLLVTVSGPGPSPNWVALGAMAAGGLLAFASMLSLGRSFGIFPANRGVKRKGPYAVVRHPMYLGYMLWQFGFVLANPGWSNALVFALATGLQLWRIQREERVLAGDPIYLDYRRQVRVRLIPGLY